jgi:hypothetical protein
VDGANWQASPASRDNNRFQQLTSLGGVAIVLAIFAAAISSM